ncbi:MAG: photosynthetic reaction centre cytochrome c subunit [Geminicoccaceae bacterium]|jgi:tetratricopeptide (TPR) repeat protein|nr:photosynthetic reaction centre cytochrome c subunit [Geminicoccaceae bacterium]
MVDRFVLRRAVVFLSVGAVVLAARPAEGQGGGQQQPYENLKYFPKDISRDSLFTIMQGFGYALGVNCQYCHVQEQQANGRPRLRPGPDDKRAKRTARFMLHMVDTINRVTLVALPERSQPAVQVNCVTCHRGSPIPGTIETVLVEAVDQFGADSAIARYRRLRENMVSGRFDFSEVPVNAVARSIAGRGKADVAIALLTMNQELNPNSADIDFLLGDIYEKQGNKDKAITHYEAVLTKRPNDPRARQRLTNLRR